MPVLGHLSAALFPPAFALVSVFALGPIMCWVALLLIHELGFPICSLIGWISRLVLSWRLVASLGIYQLWLPFWAIVAYECHAGPTLRGKAMLSYWCLWLPYRAYVAGDNPPSLRCLGTSHWAADACGCFTEPPALWRTTPGPPAETPLCSSLESFCGLSYPLGAVLKPGWIYGEGLYVHFPFGAVLRPFWG